MPLPLSPPDQIEHGTLVGILNLHDALVICADRRLSVAGGTVVHDTDAKVQSLGPGAVSFTTGLSAIIGGLERAVVFDAPAALAKSLGGVPPTDLRDALPRAAEVLGRGFERYLRSRSPQSWPTSPKALLTAGLAWYDRVGLPSVAALQLSSTSTLSLSVAVDATLWGPEELEQLVPLFFGQTAVAAAIAFSDEPEWRVIRSDPLIAKILAPATTPADVSVAEAEEYLRMVIRLTAQEGPRRFGLSATVSPDSLCYVLKPNTVASPRQ